MVGCVVTAQVFRRIMRNPAKTFLIEWWVAILSGSSAEAFLGTQGYIWDTQSDIAYAFDRRAISINISEKSA